MDIVYVNVGKVVNDGTGDDLYTAFTKINNNFQQIDYQQPQNNTASNVGAGIGIYKEKIGSDLRLKSLSAGTGISIVSEANDILISSTGTTLTVNGNSGTYTSTSANTILNIVGGTAISVAVNGNTLTINNTGTVQTDTNPSLGGNLNLNGHNISGTGTITATQFTGPITGNVTGNVTGNLLGNVTGLINNQNITSVVDTARGFDFGTIRKPNISPDIDFIKWLKYHMNVDMGSFVDPTTSITFS